MLTSQAMILFSIFKTMVRLVELISLIILAGKKYLVFLEDKYQVPDATPDQKAEISLPDIVSKLLYCIHSVKCSLKGNIERHL